MLALLVFVAREMFSPDIDTSIVSSIARYASITFTIVAIGESIEFYSSRAAINKNKRLIHAIIALVLFLLALGFAAVAIIANKVL